MKPTISISTITYRSHQHHLINNFKSLVDLKPDEVCVLDTTRKERFPKEYQQWIKKEAKKYNLPIKIGYQKWHGSYKDANNAALKMCTKDWILQLDSDEMVTKELARDLRDKIASLPPEALVLRVKKISLLDDNHAIGSFWHPDPNVRPSKRLHGRIFKRGTGQYSGSGVHEQYIYPGRRLPLSHPKHPKKDWHGYYLIHLWLYKDNFLRRAWSPKDFPFEKIIKELKKSNYPKSYLLLKAKAFFMEKRGWKPHPISKEASWIPIEWPDEEWIGRYKKCWDKES